MGFQYPGLIGAEVSTVAHGFYDLVPRNRKIGLLRYPLLMAQSTQRRLRLGMGTLKWDLQHGFPWFKFIAQKPMQSIMRAWMRRVILADPRMDRGFLPIIEIKEDPKGRHWNISFEARLLNGQVVKGMVERPF